MDLGQSATWSDFLQWIENHGKSANHDLASSSASVISTNDILGISENRQASEEALALHTIQLGEYDHQSGSVALRRNLAALYSARSVGVTEDDILIASGAAAANYITFSTILGPGDHVICQHPVDELLYKVPASLGADITLWKANPTKKWELDTDELKDLIKDNTKMIVIQNPSDPTGAIVSKPTLENLVEIAEEKGIIILADETFRPLFHSILPSNENFPPSTINLGYRNVVVTGSVSKAYSLAGVRAGWITCRDQDILKSFKQTRRYTAMQASRLDEAVATEVVSDRCIHALLARNLRLCQTNLELVQEFVDEHSWACSWARPLAGTTALIKFHKMGKPINDEAFCLKVLEQAGVIMCPASRCFGDGKELRGYVRVAFGRPTSEVKAALTGWRLFMEESYETIPTASSKPSP